MLNQHQIQCKFVPDGTNLMQILHHCRKFMQIRRQKGAGTKTHKCLVGMCNSVNIINVLVMIIIILVSKQKKFKTKLHTMQCRKGKTLHRYMAQGLF